MMNFYLSVVSGYSLLIPGVISIFRLNVITDTYYPFILFIFLGCLNEAVSIFLATNGFHTIINSNIYVIMACILLIHFFKNNKLFKDRPPLYFMVLALSITLWVLETFLMRNINEVSSYFRIYYSFLIVILSITTINKIIISEAGELPGNSLFLICVCFICYYTFKVLIEAFLIYGIKYSNIVLVNIYNILTYVNLIINLLYALAIVWIPRKQISLLKL